MNTSTLRLAMRRALPGALVAVAVATLALLPAFTIIGGVVALAILMGAYPPFLIALHAVVGWRVGRRSAAEIAPPRWRAALLLGLGTALTLILTLLIAALVGGVVLATFITLIASMSTRSAANNGGLAALAKEWGAIFGVAFWVAAFNLAAAILLGAPCAWLGAWLGLRWPALGEAMPQIAYSDSPVAHPGEAEPVG